MRFAVALASIIASSSVSGGDVSSVGRRGSRDDETASSSSRVTGQHKASVYKKLKNRLVSPNKLENSAQTEGTAKKAERCVLDNNKNNRKNKSSSDHLDFGALRGAADGCPSEDQVCVDPYMIGMEPYAEPSHEDEAASTETYYGICVDRESVPDSYWDSSPQDDPGSSLLNYRNGDEKSMFRRRLDDGDDDDEDECPGIDLAKVCPYGRPEVDDPATLENGDGLAYQLYFCFKNMRGGKNNKCNYMYPEGDKKGEVIQPACWDTSKVENMSFAFYYTYEDDDFPEEFNPDLSCWDTSRVTDMSGMFYAAYYFNGNIETWDTKKVKDMSQMFVSTYDFNRPILKTWDLKKKLKNVASMFEYAYGYEGNGAKGFNAPKVTNMDYMLDHAKIFDGDVSKWKTSKVTSMYQTFYYAFKFNPKYGSFAKWKTKKVTDMRTMFSYTKKFNDHSIAKWDVSKVKGFSYMFSKAYKFDGNLNQWNPESMINATSMFANATKFGSCLSTWAYKIGGEGGVSGILDSNMFAETNCKKKENTPSSKPEGPWCEGGKCEAVTEKDCEEGGELADDPQCKCDKKKAKCVGWQEKWEQDKFCEKKGDKCPAFCNTCFGF